MHNVSYGNRQKCFINIGIDKQISMEILSQSIVLGQSGVLVHKYYVFCHELRMNFNTLATL